MYTSIVLPPCDRVCLVFRSLLYLTCAAPEIPEAVRAQLRVGGRIVAPIRTTTQTLVEATNTEDGLDRQTHGGVLFVPMEGGDGR
jgi:protein-L-isoaspartate(D-aspartate) O-methyltransferase